MLLLQTLVVFATLVSFVFAAINCPILTKLSDGNNVGPILKLAYQPHGKDFTGNPADDITFKNDMMKNPKDCPDEVQWLCRSAIEYDYTYDPDVNKGIATVSWNYPDRNSKLVLSVNHKTQGVVHYDLSKGSICWVDFGPREDTITRIEARKYPIGTK